MSIACIIIGVFDLSSFAFLFFQFFLCFEQRHGLSLGHQIFESDWVWLRIILYFFCLLGPGMIWLCTLFLLLILQLLFESLTSATISAFVGINFFMTVDEVEILWEEMRCRDFKVLSCNNRLSVGIVRLAIARSSVQDGLTLPNFSLFKFIFIFFSHLHNLRLFLVLFSLFCIFRNIYLTFTSSDQFLLHFNAWICWAFFLKLRSFFPDLILLEALL